MHKAIREQNIQRIEPFLSGLQQEVVAVSIPLKVRYRHSVEPVPFEERLQGDYIEGRIGDRWGEAWDSAWFNLKAKIPEDWNGAAVAARIDLNGEALLFDDSGCPIYGLSGGTAFHPVYKKEIYMITECARRGGD